MFSYSDNNKCITFKPESSFNYLEKYKVTLSGDIEDHTGKKMGQDYEFRFTTVARGTVAAPIFNPAPGTYLGEQVIEINCGEPDAIIMYTTDGTNPSVNHGIKYTVSLKIYKNTLIKAMAFKKGMYDSIITEAEYLIQVTEPVFSLLPGAYDTDQVVEIKTETPDAVIHYTIDESEPSINSPIYTEPIHIRNVGTTITIKSHCSKNEMSPSTISSATFSITGNAKLSSLLIPEGLLTPDFRPEKKNIS